MKKVLLCLCVLAGILASCSKDDTTPTSGSLQTTEKEIVVSGTVGESGAAITKEVTLSGLTGELSATVAPGQSEWCSVTAVSDLAAATATLTITMESYSGNADRQAYINVESGLDKMTLQITQTGRGKSVRMIVVNEGGMNKSLADLSVVTYDGTCTYDIFKKVNNRPLGDVAQSIAYIDGNYFVALNNSKKVEVVEPQTFKSVATINYEQAGKPRFIVGIGNNQAIVSDLTDQLVRIDTKTFKVLEIIPVDDAVEKMTVVGSKIFCAAGGEVVVYDINNIKQGAGRIVPNLQGAVVKTAKLILDKNNKLWALNDLWGQIFLTRINTDTEEIEVNLEIKAEKKGAEAKPNPNYVVGCVTSVPSYNRLDFDRTRSKIYIPLMTMVDKDRNGDAIECLAIFTIDVDAATLNPEPAFMMAGIGMMYGMGISPAGDAAYLCDCLDYTAQRGYLREFTANGSGFNHRVGIYPRMVYFTEYDK